MVLRKKGSGWLPETTAPISLFFLYLLRDTQPLAYFRIAHLAIVGEHFLHGCPLRVIHDISFPFRRADAYRAAGLHAAGDDDIAELVCIGDAAIRVQAADQIDPQVAERSVCRPCIDIGGRSIEIGNDDR